MRALRFGVAVIASVIGYGCAQDQTVKLTFPGPFEIAASAPREAPRAVAPAPPAPVVSPAPPPPAAPAPVPDAPKVEVKASEITISEKVQFNPRASTIRPESSALLDAIATILKNNPQITKVLVEGHASGDGDVAHNTRLSADRAKAVVAALVARGVSSSSLTSSGAGPSKPIADNATEAGREQNRRVEFHILEQDGKKASAQQ